MSLLSTSSGTSDNATLEARLRRAIAAWRAREGVSARGFGAAALGDPGFVAGFANGRVIRLGTADRVLAFMGAEPIGPVFRREVEAFLTVTQTKVSVLGAQAAGNPSFVAQLRRGASPRLATVERVGAWMAAHVSEAEACAIRAAVAGGPCPGGDAFQPAPIHSGGIHAAREFHPNHQGDRTMQEKIHMSTREAAAYLGLSPRTLDRYRVNGAGPAFHRLGGRVRYRRADIDAWVAERRRVSTSDDGARGRRAAR